MTKFICVEKEPKDLRKVDCVIKMPNFLKEVKACANSIGRRNYMTENTVRVIAAEIVYKYDKKFNAYTNINAQKYFGRPYKTDEDIANIMFEVLEDNYPSVINEIINLEIQKIPKNIELIYFVGPKKFLLSFYNNRITELSKKELEVELGIKVKRKIMKPFPPKTDSTDVNIIK